MATVIQNPTIAKMSSTQVEELPVADSSFIQHFKYDPQTLQLTVTMKNGAQYIHWFFYPMQWQMLVEHPSKGKFYSEVIKGKHVVTKTISKNVGKPFRNHAKQEIHARHAPNR